MTYHVFCAIGSNTIWFLTFRELILQDMSWTFFVPYVIGTVSGSVFGARISMFIEKKIGAVADAKI